MAVKYPYIYKEMYLGTMDPSHADLILNAREQTEITGLKHMIFDFPPELVKRSLDEDKSIRNIIKDEGINYKEYIGELRDYQTVGVGFMYLSPRSIIGDGVGFGKTVEIAGLINYLRQREEITRFLIAVENSALGQLQCELIRFTGLKVVQLPSEAPKLRRAIANIDWNTVDGIIIKHSTLRSDVLSKWLALNINEDGLSKIFNTFILDESSVVKNVGRKIYNYTKNICDISKRVHFMNATTFETSIMDIYNQVDMMNESLLPKKWRIENEFCTFKRSNYWTTENGKAKMNWKRDLSGYKNQAIFKNSLRLAYFGRTKKDIGRDIEHQYMVYEIEPNNAQSLALSKGHRYMEVLNCPSLVADMSMETNRQNVPKLDRLCTLVENDLSDSSVMVYCFHLDAQHAIAKEMINIGRKPIILNGACTDEERFEAQRGFNDGTYDVIITNIMKSLNLYGGDVCIFYSQQGNPSKMEQIRGRIDRNVDDRIKTFILLIYKGTDEYKHFMEVVKQRAKDSRDLTIDTKGAVDFFIESMKEQELAELEGQA